MNAADIANLVGLGLGLLGTGLVFFFGVPSVFGLEPAAYVTDELYLDDQMRKTHLRTVVWGRAGMMLLALSYLIQGAVIVIW